MDKTNITMRILEAQSFFRNNGIHYGGLDRVQVNADGLVSVDGNSVDFEAYATRLETEVKKQKENLYITGGPLGSLPYKPVSGKKR